MLVSSPKVPKIQQQKELKISGFATPLSLDTHCPGTGNTREYRQKLILLEARIIDYTLSPLIVWECLYSNFRGGLGKAHVF